MSRKVKIILNPMADMHNAWRVANDLRPIINEYGGADWSGTVYPTHATALAKQAGEQAMRWSLPWAETAPYTRWSMA